MTLKETVELPKMRFHAIGLANPCNQRLGRNIHISDYFVSCWNPSSMLNNLEKEYVNLCIREVFGIFCSLEEIKHSEMLQMFQIMAKE